MSAIAQALRGQESENTQEAIRVIDIILRQHSAKQYVSISFGSPYFANILAILFRMFNIMADLHLFLTFPFFMQGLPFGSPILFP